MSVMMIMEWPGVTAAQYEAVRKDCNFEGNHPAGGLFHMAAATDQGLRVTDLWESAAQFEAFVQTRLMPSVMKVGITSQPLVKLLPTLNVFTPGYERRR